MSYAIHCMNEDFIVTVGGEAAAVVGTLEEAVTFCRERGASELTLHL